MVSPDVRQPDVPRTVDDVFAFMERRTNLEARSGLTRAYRLERMEALMEEFGRPALSIPTIHVAGSKGKGSTTAYIAALLAVRRYTVGRYTSPHVEHYRERIRVYEDDGNPRNVDELFIRFGVELHALVRHRIDRGYTELELPTTFELLTLLAFLVFREAHCDYIVLETGLGGRLDATNVCSPVATVITPIEREHTEYLGETIPEIAEEKAGIIKSKAPLFLAPQPSDAEERFRRRAREMGAPLLRLQDHVEVTEGPTAAVSARDGSFRFTATLPMIGSRQPLNLALAVLTVRRILHERTDEVAVDLSPWIARALDRLDLPGRGEIIRTRDHLFILDGAHTTGSISQLVEDLSSRHLSPVDLLFSAVQGKDADAMIRLLAPITGKVVVTRAGTFRPSDPEALHRRWTEIAPTVPCSVFVDPREAVSFLHTRGGASPILITGSFYLVAEVRRAVVQLEYDGSIEIL